MAEGKRTLLGRLGSYAWRTLKEIIKSPVTAAEKLIPQGSAEIGQGLFSTTSNAYVPYGPTDREIPVAAARDYRAEIDQAASRGRAGADRGLDRD